MNQYTNNMKKEEENKEPIKEEQERESLVEKSVCGIIMPISSIDNCSADHWTEVKKIISEAIVDAGYIPNLVSDADDIGVIQKTIIQNLYNYDIVVCDVSGKNPNVMFELGMRLAFDKPAIIIIDDKTDYSFDTAPIEHLSYPRDLRYYSILSFKDKLKAKICATVEESKKNPKYTTFLKNFGEFEVAHVEKKEGSIDDVILSRMDELSYNMNRLERRIIRDSYSPQLDDDMIKAISVIQSSITDYCKSRNLPIDALKEDSREFYDELRDYLESKAEIRRLCKSRKRFLGLLDFVLTIL